MKDDENQTDDDQKRLVRKQFGVSAGDYATSDVHAQGESLGVLLKLTRPSTHWEVLDVATGAGHTAVVFAPHVRSVVASDLTEEMLAATRRLARINSLENLRTETADAEQLPFADQSFDLVTCRLAFHHFPNPEKALSEAARVLKSGGVFALSDNFAVEDESDAAYYNEFERVRDPSHVCVYSLSRLRQMLNRAGLAPGSHQTMHKDFEFHKWADRQRVSDRDKDRLIEMMQRLPSGLSESMNLQWNDDTFWFRLHEVAMVCTKS